MSRYKVFRRKGLGYVYFEVPSNASAQAKRDLSPTGIAQRMATTYGNHLYDYEVGSGIYNTWLRMRDNTVVKRLNEHNIPYTRDTLFGSNTIGLSADQLETPIITIEKNPELIAPIEVKQVINVVEEYNKEIIADIPLSEAVILDENNNEVTIETVIEDPFAEVTIIESPLVQETEIKEDSSEVKPSKKMVFVGLGILTLGALYLASKNKKASK